MKSRAVVAISTGDSREDITKFRKETGARYPILLDDGKVAEAYAIESSPTFVEVGPGGRILSRGSHPPKGDRE